MPLRPALPAICFISETFNFLKDTPSYFLVSKKTIRFIGRFTPIPMASVHTITSVSPSKNLSNCFFLVEYGSEP